MVSCQYFFFKKKNKSDYFGRMNRRKADFKFIYKYLEDDL